MIDLSLTNIWQAWTSFRKNKKPSREITIFEAELERNLLQLCAGLNSGKYQHGGYNHRIVNEKKRRDIAVVSVRDRVVHRLIYDYLVPLVDSNLDYDVWSCRAGKGLHRALLRTHELTVKYSHGWVWRADISKFFDTVDQETLKACLARFVNDKQSLDILDKVIDSYTAPLRVSQDKSAIGIPIGNLTSQIFANVYLNEFDRYVRHHIKPHGYLRYGDDFVLFVDTKSQAERFKIETTRWLSDNLCLSVHAKNNVITKTTKGLLYLGHQIYATSEISVDKTMARKIEQKIDVRRASTYKAMHITSKQAKRIPWLLRNQIER